MAAIGSLSWQLEHASSPPDPTELGPGLRPDQVELIYAELDRIREDQAPLLALPFYDPLRRGLDQVLYRLYRELGA